MCNFLTFNGGGVEGGDVIGTNAVCSEHGGAPEQRVIHLGGHLVVPPLLHDFISLGVAFAAKIIEIKW
jgi:hypothetical protein